MVSFPWLYFPRGLLSRLRRVLPTLVVKEHQRHITKNLCNLELRLFAWTFGLHWSVSIDPSLEAWMMSVKVSAECDLTMGVLYIGGWNI